MIDVWIEKNVATEEFPNPRRTFYVDVAETSCVKCKTANPEKFVLIEVDAHHGVPTVCLCKQCVLKIASQLEGLITSDNYEEHFGRIGAD